MSHCLTILHLIKVKAVCYPSVGRLVPRFLILCTFQMQWLRRKLQLSKRGTVISLALFLCLQPPLLRQSVGISFSYCLSVCLSIWCFQGVCGISCCIVAKLLLVVSQDKDELIKLSEADRGIQSLALCFMF